MAFEVEEATIASIQHALRSGTVSASELVSLYLQRIAAFDSSGPQINAVVTLNGAAQAQAAQLDAAFERNGEFVGPLHGIPVLVKDQAETEGIMTSFGSIAMDGFMPAKDATAIHNLRRAGAIILGKTTLPDFATSWFAYSSKSGTTKNPYDLDRDPGGSSSGTGAAIAANFAAVGIGEDTGGSIRLPASFDNLVGLKVTPGLISRAGMSPLVVFQDSAGPMCRTVEDAARLLNVLAGFDPADPFTATAAIAGDKDYVAALDKNRLKNAVIGVVREVFGNDDDEQAAAVNAVIRQALIDLQTAGAKVVEVNIPGLEYYLDYTSLYVTHSRHDIDAFLAKRPVPVKTVRDIYENKQYHPLLDLFEALVDGPEDPSADPEYYERYTARENFQRIIVNEMAKVGAQALVFPTTQVPAPTRADLDERKWTTFTFPTNTLIAAQSWLPAISVPAGFTGNGLPVGLEIMGLPYREDDLLSLAYAYEQATNHRKPSPHVSGLGY